MCKSSGVVRISKMKHLWKDLSMLKLLFTSLNSLKAKEGKYASLKVFRYSFSEAIAIFFNRFQSDIFYPCVIAIKSSAMIDYRLKFVKM